MNKKAILSLFEQNNIQLLPGGIWELDSATQSKKAITANRTSNATWEMHKTDNMGKHFLLKEQNILVVDIDGEEVIKSEDGSHFVPSLGISLPKTLYTTTTRTTKYHFYYSVPDSTILGNRIVKPKINNKVVDIDFFTYGYVFDCHFYSPNASVNNTEITTLKENDPLIELVANITYDNDVVTQPARIGVTSNIARYNLTTAYLNDELNTNKSLNAFFRAIFPQEYIKEGAKKITFKSFKISYDLINKILVKLTTTAELGYEEHVIPAIRKILQDFDISPDSKQSIHTLYKQMLPSLPQHAPEQAYTVVDDALTIMEHIAKQDTPTPVFKVLVDGRPKFIQLDKHTLEPIEHNGNFILEQSAAAALNTERTIYREDGQPSGWNDQVPIVYITDDPYKPSVYVEEKHNRNVINLYERTQYLKEASELQHLPKSNMIGKLIRSSVHPDYVDLVQHYQAQVVFGKKAPVMVLWIASLKSDVGGTGKSLLTIDLFSKILGTAAVVITAEDMQGNWGDVLIGARIISLEDLPTLSSREFDKLYGAIKQATSSAQKRLNMKGSAFRTQKLNIAITGSSNERIGLHPSDRRFLCLEPAHLRGDTEPLTREEARWVEEFRSGEDYNTHLQEYVDHLLYIHNQPMSTDTYEHIFIAPPSTPYKTKWITSSQTNTANISTLLNTPWGLHDTVRLDEINQDIVIELYTIIISTYSEKTGKTAVPWNWFQEILPYIQSQKHGDISQVTYSKAQVSNMLAIDFTINVGEIYSKNWARKWKISGYVFKTTPEVIQEYKDIIGSIVNNEEPKELVEIEGLGNV